MLSSKSEVLQGTLDWGLGYDGAANGFHRIVRRDVVRCVTECARAGTAYNASCERIDLLRMVILRGLTLAASGVLVGAVVALGLTRLRGNLLYPVSPRDPRVFGAAFAVMTIAVLVACFLPAWRATRIDSVRAPSD
jgi:hypothetical protein